MNQQGPLEVYRQACQQYDLRPLNSVIEGLHSNMLNLSEMSINDLDLKAICLAIRVDRAIRFHFSFRNQIISPFSLSHHGLMEKSNRFA